MCRKRRLAKICENITNDIELLELVGVLSIPVCDMKGRSRRKDIFFFCCVFFMVGCSGSLPFCMVNLADRRSIPGAAPLSK